MYRAAKEAGISQAEHFADTDALLAALPELLHPGDSVLIKASHGMGYAKIVEALEKQEVRYGVYNNTGREKSDL